MSKPKAKKKSQIVPRELLAAAALQRQGRLDEAEQLFHRTLEQDATNWQALHQLGAIHLARRQYAQALQFIGAAMKANAGSAEITSNYGVVLRRLKRDHEAIEYFNRALMLKPGYLPALLTRGASLQRIGRREEALATLDRVLQLDPNHAKAHYNRAGILHELRRFDEALEAFARAAALAPDDADVHWNESLTRLLCGDYRRGWQQYEWRLKLPHHIDRKFSQPLWLGETSPAGKTVLVHAEQGFGDTLQFVRYVPLLAAMGARVVLETQPALKPLIASLAGVAALLAQGEAPPAFDLHCPVMSLPLAFKTELSTIPASVPYLAAPKERIEVWRPRIPASGKLRIALACSGSAGNEENDIRSIPLAHFAPLFADSRIQWIVVQRELLAEDAAFLRTQPQVVWFGEELADFADTAAIVSLVDHVVSVCTSLAHLAGALNLPFTLLSKHSPDFRWLLDREDSPWYPSARILRQPQFGDWQSVIVELGETIARLKTASPAR